MDRKNAKANGNQANGQSAELRPGVSRRGKRGSAGRAELILAVPGDPRHVPLGLLACPGQDGRWQDQQPDYSTRLFRRAAGPLLLLGRRDRSPPRRQDRLAGPPAILLSVAIRIAGARYYVDAIDAWSMVVWAAGVVWLLGGCAFLGLRPRSSLPCFS